jgi:hypothetical protein
MQEFANGRSRATLESADHDDMLRVRTLHGFTGGIHSSIDLKAYHQK